MVEAQARVQAESDDPPVLSASVEVEERGDDRWTLTLEVRRGEALDVRTVHGESCEAVVEAAALIVSLPVMEWTRPTTTDADPEPRSTACSVRSVDRASKLCSRDAPTLA